MAGGRDGQHKTFEEAFAPLREQGRPDWFYEPTDETPRDIDPAHFQCLTYMSDVEDQTPMYALFSLLNPAVQKDVELIGFLFKWANEEWWHGEQHGLLRTHFDPDALDRRERRLALQQQEGLTRVRARMLGSFALPAALGPEATRAVVYARGFQNEMQTKYGYAQLLRQSGALALRACLPGIIIEEDGHASVYESLARELLDGSRKLQLRVRTVLQQAATTIVGEEYRGRAEADFIIRTLFSGESGNRMIEQIDDRFSSLPGMHGLRLMRQRVDRALALP